MCYFSLIEIDYCISFLIIIIYGLFSLKNMSINLTEVYFISRLSTIIFIIGMYIESCIENSILNSIENCLEYDLNIKVNKSISSISLISSISIYEYIIYLLNTCISLISFMSIDCFIAILFYLLMGCFKSLEAILLLLCAFISNIFLIHSIDFISFFISLEIQNFCFFVLCALITSKNIESFTVESVIKYFIFSAFTTGFLLYWFSIIYCNTGCITFNSFFLYDLSNNFNNIYNIYNIDNNKFSYIFNIQYLFNIQYFVCIALLFKLGLAPLHFWVTSLYSSVKRNCILYISTIPKCSLFGFWLNNFQYSISFSTLLVFSLFSLILGAFSAYNQPVLRTLFAYSTINELGFMLCAIESAGWSFLFLSLFIYIISQFLLWNLHDFKVFNILILSFAGLPPFAGFFAKAFIFWHISNIALISSLFVACLCTVISLIYYLRIFRLFWFDNSFKLIRFNSFNNFYCYNSYYRVFSCNYTFFNRLYLFDFLQIRVFLTSFCIILLIFSPFIFIKPFFFY